MNDIFEGTIFFLQNSWRNYEWYE